MKLRESASFALALLLFAELFCASSSDQMEEKTIDTSIITCIGDSVLLGASDELQELLPSCVIDAKVSRQTSAGLSVAQELDAEGKLGDVVVIALGINGGLNKSTGQKLIDYLGTERTIYWVTGYGKTVSWQDETNATIYTLSQENNNVTVIDWATLAENHPEWLYNDGIHLKSAGKSAYANMIYDALGFSKDAV